jgi:hypothetical protein
VTSASQLAPVERHLKLRNTENYKLNRKYKCSLESEILFDHLKGGGNDTADWHIFSEQYMKKM